MVDIENAYFSYVGKVDIIELRNIRIRVVWIWYL